MSRCPEELKEQFIADSLVLTVPALAETYGKSVSTVKEWRVSLYREGELLWWPGIRVHIDGVFDDWVRVEGDVIVTGDLEVPYHDAELLGYQVAIAKLFGIKKLVIGGDFLTVDALSYWPLEEGDRFRTLTDDIVSGEDVLTSLFEWFDSITILKGNHEQRASGRRELGFIQRLQTSWEALGDVEVSCYKWCRVYSGGEVYRVEHPGNYSKVPGSVARERAEIEDEHTICLHGHHFSWSFTKNGKHQAIDGGHCTRPDSRYYKAVNGTTRHPKWVPGFWVIRNGYVYPFPKEFTDWQFWLKELKLGGK